MEVSKQRYVLASLILSFIPVGLLGGQISPAAHPDSTLQGILRDVSGVPVPGVTVVIEGEESTRKIVSDNKGAFKVVLPSGMYRISSAPWEGYLPAKGAISKSAERWATFRTARRAAFRLPPAATVTINFILIDSKRVSLSYPGAKQNEYFDDGPRTDIEYEDITLPFASAVAPKVVVQFGEKVVSEKVIDYTADISYGGRSVYTDPHPGVMLTYDLLTVYANRIRFDKKKSKFKAEGNVVIENGGHPIRVKRAEVEFKGSEPVLKLIH